MVFSLASEKQQQQYSAERGGGDDEMSHLASGARAVKPQRSHSDSSVQSRLLIALSWKGQQLRTSSRSRSEAT